MVHCFLKIWSNKRMHPNERRNAQRPPCCHSWRHSRWQRNGPQTNQLSGRTFTHNLGNSPIFHIYNVTSFCDFPEWVVTAVTSAMFLVLRLLVSYICWLSDGVFSVDSFLPQCITWYNGALCVCLSFYVKVANPIVSVSCTGSPAIGLLIVWQGV